MGGGGGTKDYVVHNTHNYEHDAQSPLLSGSGALNYLSLCLKHSDTKWDANKKILDENNGGGGGVPVVPCCLDLPLNMNFIISISLLHNTTNVTCLHCPVIGDLPFMTKLTLSQFNNYLVTLLLSLYRVGPELTERSTDRLIQNFAGIINGINFCHFVMLIEHHFQQNNTKHHQILIGKLWIL